MGAAGGGEHDLLRPGHSLGHADADGLQGLKIPLDAAVDHHLLGEVGEHQAAGTGCDGRLHRLGVGDGFPHHREEAVAGQHGGCDLLGGLLAVLSAGLHNADGGFSSHPVDLGGQSLGNAQTGQLRDDQDLLAGLDLHTGVDHLACSTGHIDIFHSGASSIFYIFYRIWNKKEKHSTFHILYSIEYYRNNKMSRENFDFHRFSSMYFWPLWMCRETASRAACRSPCSRPSTMAKCS